MFNEKYANTIFILFLELVVKNGLLSSKVKSPSSKPTAVTPSPRKFSGFSGKDACSFTNVLLCYLALWVSALNVLKYPGREE